MNMAGLKYRNQDRCINEPPHRRFLLVLGACLSLRFFFAAQPRLLSLEANILQGPIHRLRGERFMDIENPNPLFLAQAGWAAHWAENDLILGSLNFQQTLARVATRPAPA